MKTIRNFIFYILCGLLVAASLAHAEDIDIYTDNGGTTGVPNVLLILDNAANFSASAGSCKYSDGTSPSLDGTTGGIEQCAIYNVIQSLPEDTINIGLMVYNANNIKDIDNANCSGANGGCLVQPLALMSGAVKTKFLAWIKSWRTTGGAGDGYIKANGETTGATIQEAWAYYAGKTGLSGRDYANIQPPSGCQKNFVIFIGNAFNVSGTPGDGGSASPKDALAAAPGVTAAQLTNITIPSGSHGAGTFSCGNYTMGSHTDSSGLYADEWTRYMYQTDLYTGLDEKQGITTYTVGLLGPSCKADYPALLRSMADVGGGKYFATSNYDEIATAILKILNEIQAVNSVFASASLPVSVNAQGTFDNQLFLGMFRPDGSGNPRWQGNLKQYSFLLEYADPLNPDPNTATLKLGDQNGKGAISSAGTGFITPSADSYWTKKDITKAPDSTGGFFANNSQGDGGAFDKPDGQLVEKGGAAQQLRLANLTADYTAAAGSSTNPRRLYTYCPSGSGCEANLTHSSNAFTTANSGISGLSLSSVASVSVLSIVRTDTTAVVTTGANHGFISGDTITISGATQSEYNGVKALITKISNTSFSFTVPENPPSPALGSYTVSIPSSPQSVGSITRSGTTATVTLTGHGYVTGQAVTISGANQASYNNTFTITKLSNDTFSVTVVEGPSTPAGGGTAKVGATTRNIEAYNANPNVGIVRSGTLVTVTTTANHGFANSGSVTMAGVVNSANALIAEYNGVFNYVKTGAKTFTYSIAATTPASPATGTIKADEGAAPKTITSLTRSGSVATATVAAHGFPVGETVNIGGTTGTNEGPYVGGFVITAVPTANTFSYTVTTTPVTPATGTIVAQKAGSSDRTSLINWVRGEDNFGDELSPGNGYTVRPSIHGDVLHSRPAIVNYGDSRGVVVFYGANDGVFRAINGNKAAAMGSVSAGGELWGLVLREHFDKLNRQRVNSPELKLSSTTLASAQPKDYFIDGIPSLYQERSADGLTISKAYLYLTMRRGGRFMYAFDVTQPTDPKFMWKISASGDFSELGQTWSAPVPPILVRGYANPLLVFGAGYDPAEDAEPPGTNTMGRGIFAVDAVTGAMVWKATYGASSACAGSTTKAACTVAGMNWAIPADIAYFDRDNDGYPDRLYAADVGGNVWRVDLEPTAGVTPDNWKVTKFAEVGCNTGACTPGNTPRKFMYPPNVIPVGVVGATGSYDAVLLGSGDREHPLKTSASYNVANRFYMLKDTKTGKDAGTPTAITEEYLYNASSLLYDQSLRGFYVNFGVGEKQVNASFTTRGTTYFSTNQPAPPSATSCTSNLGIARNYAVRPFTGAHTSLVLDGGGLPGSGFEGSVRLQIGADLVDVPFCIGCEETVTTGVPLCSAVKSQLEVAKLCKPVPKAPRRTYWYKR